MNGYVILFFIGVAAAALVAAIAQSKGHNSGAWFLYGLFLWPVALVHIAIKDSAPAVRDEERVAAGELRKCPMCAELIKREAVKCRFCGSSVQAVA